MTIPLGRRLLAASSSLPGSRNEPDRLCFLFGLAPGGVCQARRVTPPAGALLPPRFTIARAIGSRLSALGQKFSFLLKADSRKPTALRLFAFCCTFPDLAAGGRYPPPCPTVPGLSSRSPCSEPALTQTSLGNIQYYMI